MLSDKEYMQLLIRDEGECIVGYSHHDFKDVIPYPLTHDHLCGDEVSNY